jgi:hypothetical protein
MRKYARTIIVNEKRFYFNRTFGSDCYYCIVDGNIDAGTAAGKETGKSDYLPIKPQVVGHYLCHVYRRQSHLNR